jgi:thiamine biosynthesis lipoprotein
MVPDDQRLGELLRHVGFAKIAIDATSSSLLKSDPLVVADLSAIAKGYAVDGLADLLLERGYTEFLVEVGGELRSSGEKPGGIPWVVGVEAPLPDTRSLYATIESRDEAVATSGDYRNFWDADGSRYSHIIDPRTGRPLPYVGAAVTVIHQRAVLADAWATAMTVLGPEPGKALADRLGLGVIFVQQGEADLTETRSSVLSERRLEPMH